MLDDEEALVRLVEEESANIGASYELCPVRIPECAGGSPVPHLRIGSHLEQIPVEDFRGPDCVRAWFRHRKRPPLDEHCSRRRPPDSQEVTLATQLVLDFGL